MSKQHRILVVDDLPDWRDTLSGLLKDEQYETRTAGSFDEALDLLDAERFDLALLDMRLEEPDESNTQGLDLATEIKRRWPNVKIVIVTGYGTPETAARALRPDAGRMRLAEDFVEKNQTEKLIAVVKKVLSK